MPRSVHEIRAEEATPPVANLLSRPCYPCRRGRGQRPVGKHTRERHRVSAALRHTRPWMIDVCRHHKAFIPMTPRLTLLPAPSIEAGHCVLDRPRNYVRCGCPYPHALLPHAPMPLPLAGRVCQSYGGLTLRGDPGAIFENNANQFQFVPANFTRTAVGWGADVLSVGSAMSLPVTGPRPVFLSLRK